MTLIKLTKLTGMAAISVLLSACTQVGDAVVARAMSLAANDQIMLVRREPASFGFLRLASQAKSHPDLQTFISTRGLPDFLAETSNRDRQYFILYFLKGRQAFACRTRSENSQAVEFSGPYPITDKEFRLLDGFRKNPNQAPIKL